MSTQDKQRQIPKDFIDQVYQHIHYLLNTVGGIDTIMLCSTDGFELVLASKKNWANSGKIAAVSSSIWAMISAFISELNLDDCSNMTLDAHNGKVILSTVDHPQYPMVLVIITAKDILIGQLLYEMKQTVKVIVQQ